ncbi:hypothetical protein ACHAXS_013523, partial [Conticribra weissflogii]
CTFQSFLLASNSVDIDVFVRMVILVTRFMKNETTTSSLLQYLQNNSCPTHDSTR